MPYKYRDTNRIEIDPQTTTGAIVEIDNSDNLLDLTALSVGIEPVQDLHGYDKPWAGGAGKNKLPCTATTTTVKGVTFTVASDGTITANGTATANVLFQISLYSLPLSGTAVSYILSGSPSGASTSTYYVDCRNDSGGQVIDLGSGKEFTSTGQTSKQARIVIISGQRVNNVVFKPMIRLASETDATYEPYENICPISGWNEVNVTRTGRNLVAPSGLRWGFYSNSGEWIIGSSNHKSTDMIPVKPNTKYISAVYNQDNSEVNSLAWSEFDENKRFVTQKGTKIITTGATTRFVVARNYNAQTALINSGNFVYKIEEAETDSGFIPYDGEIYAIDLNGTRYGGTLDVTSGVLTVDRAMATYDGSPDEGWIADGATRYSINISNAYADGYTRIKALSNEGLFASRGGSVGTIFVSNKQLYYYPPSSVTSLSEYKTWLASNPLQVIYPLATPQTYQLTPTEASALLGTNNIWADIGDVSVTAVVDVERLKTLPTEAVSIDGRYLENLIEGYSTLYVKGRESLDTELNTFSVGVADGEFFKNRRYPARVLTVGFQLLCPNAEEFRVRFNQLNNILSIEEADFIFADEQDKYFTGTPIMDADIEAGRNNVTGEWKIFCGFPFKRSVELITLSTDDEQGVVVEGNKATFSFEYNGSYPSKPLLRATFASAKEGGDYNEDGDCGYIAFFDDEENIIQLGNPDVLDVDELNKNGTLANSEFDALTDWTARGISVGSITDTYWNRGAGQTMNFAKGTGTLRRNTDGAVGFEFDIVHRLCVSTAAQAGSFKALLKSGAATIVGFIIEKTGAGTTARVKYILNDKVVGTDNIDIGYYNTSFGYCRRNPVYVNQTYKQKVVQTVKKGKKKVKKTTYVTKTRKVQKGWSYTQSNLNSGISRDGGVVTFSVGNLPDRTFKMADIENTPAYDVVFETTGNFHTNAIRSCAFIRKAGVPFAEIPNVFTAGDVVEADCNDANVYLYRKGSAEGHLEPQYGALGNDWEDFSIKAGTNVIAAAWSEWVDENYKPKIEIIFNEVNI